MEGSSDMKRTRWTIRILTGFLLGLASAGCQTVHVCDPEGKSIQGVTVSIQFGKTDNRGRSPLTEVTNKRGNATFAKPMSWEHPIWMTLNKFGYMPRGVTYPTGGYVYVVLTPIGSDPSEPSEP